MQEKSDWQYDEFQHVGTDYQSVAEVEAYDRRMRMLRNIDGENKVILDAIRLSPESTVLEIGTGTAEFALAAASRCKEVHAVDISPTMLEYAKQKADSRGITNVEFHQAGFLTYQHEGEKLDAVVTELALHHLPDFWKGVALRRIYEMLRPGGRFYLRDVVYCFDVCDYVNGVNKWIEDIRDKSGDAMAVSSARHIKQEYSTLSWIMEGLLESTGFNIVKANYHDGFMASYLCVREA